MFNKKILAIDIGNKNIKIVLGKKNGNKVIVYKNFIIKTPENSFSDGELTDTESIRKVIFDKLNENNIKTKATIVTINSSSIITREIDLPVSKEKHLNNILKFQIQEYLPINLNDFIIEHKIIDKFTEDNQNKYRVLVAALPKNIVDSYMKLLMNLHLKPIGLDYNANTISKLFPKRSYSIDNQILDETYALLDLGHNFININIMSNGTSKLVRTLNTGGKDININIANTFNISLSEAEEKKMYDAKISESESNSETSVMINDIVLMAVNNQAQQIENIFRYFTSKIQEQTIDKIFLYGGGCNLKGIDKYINNYFNIPTYKIKYFKLPKLNIVKLNNIKLGKYADKGNLEHYLNCISAIIRD